MKPDRAFWSGRRVFLTGHTGFKGAWLTLLLVRLGAQVSGFSLPGPVSAPSLFDAARLGDACEDRRGDVRDLPALEAALAAAHPEVLIHMAAQPIVRASVADPLGTLDVNVMGTAKVLDAARRARGLQAIVVVTSDKCYENRERVWPYRENEAMGGSDPYSASKGAAELVAAAFARTYFGAGSPRVVGVRAGNVIGGGDWAADRLIPDLVRAAQAGARVEIRSPDAVRPWQHVLDPLCGYLLAAERVFHGKVGAPYDAWNFGPDPGEELTVREVVEAFRETWPGPLDVRFRVGDPNGRREAGLLRVDSTKAKVELGWRPGLANAAAVSASASWYSMYAGLNDDGAVRKFTESQIGSLSGV